MSRNASGKSHRRDISVIEMADMFATEADAEAWLEGGHWPDRETACLRCDSANAYRVKWGWPMAWFMLHRIRGAFADIAPVFECPV
ncbi:MAG: hypothetical protein F4139_09070 [Gemmatimonadetes bacterium]|nr:hypothetical protein [Gemmatimonadota bacterium]MYA64601.1 hypothetical protein [Gemmatimonadota bacterium]MYB97942.1 hypothetical protein [Gemmatimonadota bacterium]MYH53089.1 hypothetical protein [Gemmatimonadota bacterium]MYI46013.1 hypothetical protein [Gemmatimonadota bacterium]